MVQRLNEQGQRTKDMVEVGRVWGGSARPLEVHGGFIRRGSIPRAGWSTVEPEAACVL